MSLDHLFPEQEDKKNKHEKLRRPVVEKIAIIFIWLARVFLVKIPLIMPLAFFSLHMIHLADMVTSLPIAYSIFKYNLPEYPSTDFFIFMMGLALLFEAVVQIIKKIKISAWLVSTVLAFVTWGFLAFMNGWMGFLGGLTFLLMFMPQVWAYVFIDKVLNYIIQAISDEGIRY